MKHQKLFRHPVGMFSFAARWYLAALAVMALMLVSVHFVIHIQAQRQAQQLMQQWLGQAHIDVEQVRYHLLRNALMLKNIHVVRGKNALRIGQILVIADARALMSGKAKLGNIELSGVEADISDFGRAADWRQDANLQHIWDAVEDVHFQRARLVLHPGGEQSPPLEFDAIEFKQQKVADGFDIKASGELYGASVRMELRPASNEKQRVWHIVWQGVQTDAVTASMGWAPLTGVLDGSMVLQGGLSDAPEGHGDATSIVVRMNLMCDEDTASHRLDIQGVKQSGQWQLNVKGEAWPLDPWKKYWPKILGQKLVSGVWQGDMHVVQEADVWSGHSRQGELKHVNLLCAHDGDSTCQLKALRYRGLHWNRGERIARVDEAVLQHLSMVVRSDAEPAALFRNNWHLQAGKVIWEDLSLSFENQQGRLRLSALQGEGRVDHNGVFAFKLASAHPSGAAPVPQWSLSGEVKRQGLSWGSGNVVLNGSEVPLAQLRAVIPLKGSPDWPIRLEGLANLHVQASVDNGRWIFSGDMAAANIMIAHSGDVLSAKQAQLDFGPLGAGLKKQVVQHLDIRGWHYVAALHPLGAFDVERTGETNGRAPFWWARLLHNHNWVVDSLRAVNGIISVGRGEAHWATGINITGKNLNKDDWSEIALQGLVDGGTLDVHGHWVPFAGTPLYKLKAELQHANVFFLHDWLQASGLPRLIRGRLSMDLTIDDGPEEGAYRMHTSMKLARGKVEGTPSPEDPLLERFGYSLADVLLKLDDGKGHANVSFDVQGNWKQLPPSMNRWGQALQQTVLARMGQEPLLLKKTRSALYEARVRIHNSGHLSHNERARLRKLWRHLRTHKQWVVDLEPVWSGDELNAAVVRRIRYTQGLVESFMHERGIGMNRIYPQWPLAKNRAKDLGFVHVLVRAAD